MKPILALVLALSALVAEAEYASAEDYPTRPIRVLTANSVGGTSDIFVRALADKLQQRLGQPIIVDNRPGGAMMIAGRACADAANDGYTICLLPNETLTLNQYIYKSISYDPEKDFVPITNAFINTQVMVVSSSLHVDSLAGLAETSKAKPGTLSYSALAIPMQIVIENWKKTSGADLVFVPVRGGGDMVNGLLTGTTPVALVGLPNFISYIRDGTVKAIAVDSEERSPLFPNVPTLKELGFTSFARVYFAFVAPAGVPRPIIDRLHDEIATIGNDPEFRKARLLDIGIVPVFDTPEHLGTYLKEQRAISAKLIKDSNFQARQ
ncbi:MAG TPA: tripartite tricarboxylate transporter substrate binding protein [Xanthobacteraceae bacterium]|jgi:tripartite-type tricarboxylate transporter receptor subunit TctC|nr:tripartite tricarboxylate transporter substrate binding protein [Xanthobacteraceae bacterium]